MARATWGQIPVTADLDATWTTIGPRLELITTAAQYRAATDGARYVQAALDEQGIPADMIATANPRALAGVASDGRALASLLYQPLWAAKQGIANGLDPVEALRAARFGLDRIMTTQVADAARVSAGVALTAAPAAGGYTRMLNLPSCGRCIVLAGRFYRWNAGFMRHPTCDCRHVPTAATVADPTRTDARHAFESMTAAQQNRAFTVDGARAIRDGADPARVINARRGMTTAGGVKVTTSQTSRRGRATRLMPESIYQIAGGDRDLALKLLRQNGYVLDRPKAPTLRMPTAEDRRWARWEDPRTAPTTRTFDPDNPLKFYGSKLTVYDRSPYVEAQLRDLEKLPEHMHRVLRSYMAEQAGAGIYIGERKLPELDSLGDLRGAPPRGWREGSTFDEVGGVQVPGRRVVALAGKGSDGSVSVAMHEASHMFDGAVKVTQWDADLSSRHNFRTIADKADKGQTSAEAARRKKLAAMDKHWDALAEKLGHYPSFEEMAANPRPRREYGYRLHPYFSKTGNPDGHKSEMFAEAHAAYLKSGGDPLAIGKAIATGADSSLRALGKRYVAYFDDLHAQVKHAQEIGALYWQ